MMRTLLRASAFLAGCLPAVLGYAAPAPVAELHYRSILFDFYQDDYFSASTRSMVYEEQQVLGERRRDAELLRGGMFLSYGLFDAAKQTFEKLLDDAQAQSLRDRAWYHLGRLAYQRNDLDTAEAALERISDDADRARLAQRALLLGLIAMRRGDYQTALDRLSAHEDAEQTGHYALYNMGIAALNAGQTDQGRRFLDRIAKLETEEPALLALRDKANVALGFSALRAEDPAAAAQAFGNVRLTGPFATKALLGAGWAATNAGQHRRALVSWNALMERPITAPAVQEAYLAAPHGLLELGAEQQAAQAYRRGIEGFSKELKRLNRAMETVRGGELIKQLRSAAQRGDGGDWPVKLMRDVPGGEYLPQLLASHDFQQAADNFRDLFALQRHLNYWAESMDGFDRMLQNRRERYEQNVAAVDKALAELDLAPLMERRDALARRLENIRAQNDAVALATEKERERLDKLAAMEDRLARLPASERESLAQRHKVLTGFQRWQIATDFEPRIWEARKTLDALDAAIGKLEDQRNALIQARENARARFEGFARRIDEARGRIATLHPRVNAAIEKQRNHLQGLAEAALGERQQRLRDYLSQAQFALAQLYDRARNRGDAEAEQ